ncbi:MAG: cupin domain-containing protein [Chloroflexi bacterium]|nr:cupin domain-containing protein [Chloroflexota bacterium]
MQKRTLVDEEGPQRWFHEEWMQQQGIPVYREVAGIEDIAELPRRPWARMGGLGTFIELQGTKEAGKLLYVVEIPSGGSLEPEKHLYDELIYVLRGRGLSEVWQEGQSKRTFEWGEGSLFAIPLNAWHRLVNGSREPVVFFSVSNAPLIMEALRNTEFVFNCNHNFTDRYQGQADYFLASDKRRRDRNQTFWETNFVPDVRNAFLDDAYEKVAGGQLTFFTISSWTTAHSSEWPVGRYHKAHFHGPGAVLLGLKSVGYVLVWPRQYGIHPYQDGQGDKVIKMDWKPGSIYSPYGYESFHQHFNSGPEPARHLAVTGGGSRFGAQGPNHDERGYLGFISVREGGRLIEYEDEDPAVRRMFEEELRKKGIKCTMPPVVYRTDPFKQ